MAGKSRIIAFGTGSDSPAEDVLTLTEEVGAMEVAENQYVEDMEADAFPPSPQRPAWLPDILAPALAVAAAVGWTGAFAWAHRTDVAAAAPLRVWTGLVTDWATPVLLIGVLWLLAMRNSRREAARFARSARALSDESARLEARLLTVNRELSLAREFITAQSRDLETLGRLATEKLSLNADRLQSLIQDNGSRIQTIAGVSEAALDNMEKLRGQLPVIASAAKDVANNIGLTGRTAQTQLDDLNAALQRLEERNETSEKQVQALCRTVDDTIAEFSHRAEQLDESFAARLTALVARGEEFRTQLETHEAEALASLRGRAASLAEELQQTRCQLDGHEEQSLTSLRARLSALRDESGTISRSLRESETRALESWRDALNRIEEEIREKLALLEKAEAEAVEATRSRLDELAQHTSELESGIAESGRAFSREMKQRRSDALSQEEAAAARIAAQLTQIDAELAERRAAHERQSAEIAAQGDAIMARLSDFERQSAQISALGEKAETHLSASVQALSAKLGESREALAGTDREVALLTDASVRLLELIRAGTDHSKKDLAQTLAANEQHLTAIDNSISGLRQAMEQANGEGQALSGLLTASAEELRSAFREIDDLQGSLEKRGNAHGEKLAELRQSLEELERQTQGYADKARTDLSDAIEKLANSGQEAIESFSRQGGASVSSLADRLGAESAEAIDRAMRGTVSETAGQIEAAVSHAAGVSREAATQLRNQLVKVSELVTNLEKRVEQARERAEEQVDNDFSRRAALITESLNSNAIDIAKALSSDVTETAWAAYLRGERGIFTRRAVRLLENSEAKAVSQLYEQDRDFNEHVSRYIHDFEAMLRQVLSTRDGHALGVTLLSSDMGKLYVVLAQSIERLRS